MGAAPETQTAGPPVPQDNLSEGSNDDSSSRQRRKTTAHTMQSAVSDISKKIRKETLSIFDPDNPNDRDRQGLITTSTGKTIYTNVFIFCEHLYLFKRYSEFSLTEYYIRMLTRKASAWLMSEQCEQRRTTIEHFCRHSNRGNKGKHRYKSDRYSGRDKGSRSDRRSRDERSSSERRDNYDRLRRDNRYRNDRPSRSYTKDRKSDDKSSDRRRGNNRDRHSRSRNNNYIHRDVKEEKKVHFKRKYPALEKEEDKLGSDRPDTDTDSKSVCSSRSSSSQQAYFSHITGGIVTADIVQEFPYNIYHQIFPSKAVLWEHRAARSYISPMQLASEQAPAKPKRYIHCHRDFLSRNKLHRHLKSGCSEKPVAQEVALQVDDTTASTGQVSTRVHH
ncbi:hypothetical protein FNYG_15888 [Fusarium nygamai]|uniref:Uncharacterized protein n=1 Tax=Gibberella nygamai TaxID=42673 RepID=A0A2K0U1I3_GIBNY|nr:hypothetical protein FNYG_15888 [Fusarium nygamai]